MLQSFPKLNKQFPDWKYKAPPLATQFRRVGGFNFNTAHADGETLDILKYKPPSNQILIVQSIETTGFIMSQEQTVFDELGRHDLRGKISWTVATSSDTQAFIQQTRDHQGEVAHGGFYELIHLSSKLGTIAPLVISPSQILKIVLRFLDDSKGVQVVEGEELYLSVAISGYSLPYNREG